MRCVRLLVLVLVLVLGVLAACTFPDVDYADDAGGACASPAACAGDAGRCGDTARKKRRACDEKCKPHESECRAACASALTSAIAACTAECEICAAEACGGSATNCAALSGE